MGRITKAEDTAGNVMIYYQYDVMGNLFEEISPKGAKTSYTYDRHDELTSITDAAGNITAYEVDLNRLVTKMTQKNGGTYTYQYDAAHRLTDITTPLGLKTTLTYDVADNIVKQADSLDRVDTFEYDIMHRMTKSVNAEGGVTTYGYDIRDNQNEWNDALGYTWNYQYDLVDQLTASVDPEGKDGVIYAYDVTGQGVSMMDRSGESTYEYDGLGRITKVTTGSGEVTSYTYDECDQLESIIYPDGKTVTYKYDKNDNLVAVTDRTGAVTTYVYDEINRVTEIHRPNGVSAYNTYNARDQIVSLQNICDDCGWVVSQYDYTYDDCGFIVGETAVESLHGYTWDDKHDGKHENGRHDDLFSHGNQHTNKHAKDGEYNFQIVETVRSFEYDDDGKLLRAVEDEEQQGQYIYTYRYDDMGNRTFYSKTRNGVVQESAEYTYNVSNQIVSAKIYDGKKNTTIDYTYDADGNLIAQDGKIGTDKVELTYIYTVENRLKAVYDADELLVAMAYEGDGNRIFQLNYNLHTDDDWKGNSGNGNGNNKDNTGNGNSTATAAASENTGIVASIVAFFTGEETESVSASETEAVTVSETASDAAEDNGAVNGNKDKDKGNDGNDKNNGVGNGNGNSNSGNNGNGNGSSSDDSDTGSNGSTESGTASGNTTNTESSTNQGSILFPIEGEVSELEQELIDMIKTTGKEKNYELIEYVNDVNREYAEVLMELNINGIMDTAYSYGNERLINERFTGWTGYYTYDPRGSVSGVTDSEGMIWQSYRYDGYGNITFGKPEYNNVYAYNAESFNPNVDVQYLRARYYCPTTADFLTEDTYLGNISDPLILNRYNYVKSSPLNYVDPSGHEALHPTGDPNSFELPEVVYASNASKNLKGEFEAGYNLFSVRVESDMEDVIELTLSSFCEGNRNYNIVERSDINGIGLEWIDDTGYILFGNDATMNDAYMLILLDKMERANLPQDKIDLVIESYRNVNKESLIRKDKRISYYTGADDVTHDLWKEMIKNECEVGKTIGSMNIVEQYTEFYEMVRNKGPLDLKQKPEWQNSALYIFDGELVDRDAPGNISYGYVGKVFGFSDTVLKGASGAAQIMAGTSRAEWIFSSFGDDPADQKNVERGIEFYDKTH